MTETRKERLEKTLTVNRAINLISRTINLDSPLGKATVSTLLGENHEELADTIVKDMNYARFQNSGLMHIANDRTDGKLIGRVNQLLEAQIQGQFVMVNSTAIADGEISEDLDYDAFKRGYLLGMGATDLASVGKTAKE